MPKRTAAASILLAALQVLTLTPRAAMAAAGPAPEPAAGVLAHQPDCAQTPPPATDEDRLKRKQRLFGYIAVASAPLLEEGKTLPPLRMGQSVEVHCRSGGLLYASAGDAQAGLIQPAHLQYDAPDAAQMLAGLLASDPAKPAERIELARAAIALDPMALQAWDVLIDALQRERRDAELAQAREIYAHVRAQTVLREPDEPQLLFARQDDLIAPLAMLSNGQISDFPSTQDEARYFRPGRLYYAYANGTQGKLVVSGKKEVSCASNTAKIYEVSPISGDALVSNAPLPHTGDKPAFRPDASQAARIRILAAALLRQHQVAARHIAAALKEWPGENQGLHNFAAIPSANGKPPTLLANLAPEISNDADYAGFALSLIAEALPSGRYAVSYSSFSEGESTTSRYAFLTSADLDGDGQQEIVLAGYGYEWWWYEILRKKRGKWLPTAQANGGGC